MLFGAALGSVKQKQLVTIMKQDVITTRPVRRLNTDHTMFTKVLAAPSKLHLSDIIS